MLDGERERAATCAPWARCRACFQPTKSTASRPYEQDNVGFAASRKLTVPTHTVCTNALNEYVCEYQAIDAYVYSCSQAQGCGGSAQIASSGTDVQSEDGCTIDGVTDVEDGDIVRIMLP